MSQTFKDSVIVTVRSRHNGKSKLRDVPGTSGLRWALHVYLFGLTGKSDHIAAYIQIVGGSVTVKGNLEVYDESFCHEIDDGQQRGCDDLLKNNGIPRYYDNSTFKCTATFEVKSRELPSIEVKNNKLEPVPLHELIYNSRSHRSDAKIVIDTTEIKIHRDFLSMISPVFNTIFGPETKESQIGIVKIADFSVATVQNALDYCYGVDTNVKNATEVIHMLRFYDKYDIQPLITKLEAWLKANMTVKNFAPIAAYAWRWLDSISVTFTTTDNVTSQVRDVPGAPGRKWWISVYPLGITDDKGYVDASVHVAGGGVTMNANIVLSNEFVNGILKGLCHEFKDGGAFKVTLCNNVFVMMAQFTLTVTCNATFHQMGANLVPLMVHEMFQESYQSDAAIAIGEDTIKVHRGFLSMVSPVFKAMFNPETQESQTGIVKITDFSVTTVKNALDYCYGVDVGKKTAVEVVDMLRFYDKYDLQSAIKKLEAWLKANLAVKNFAPIAAYAWQYSRESLQAECGRVFRANSTDLVVNPDFVNLDPVIVSGVLKACLISSEASIPETS
uniref:BTB domain-containing protein n=1 Tax=Panagrellus redivivus TaxID=6233 RepID=A0A7E4ZQY1_PANRE